MRGYAWTEKDIKRYIDMKSEEDFRLLESVDASVKAAMEALGNELEAYLKEAGENINLFIDKKSEIKKEKKPSTVFDPFMSLGKGFGEIVGIDFTKKKEEKKGLAKFQKKQESSVAKKVTAACMYQTYKEFKKKCGIIHW